MENFLNPWLIQFGELREWLKPYWMIHFGLEEICMLAISIGLSLLAAKLMQKRIRSPITEQSPTTLVTRGSYIPWFVGRRRIGYIFAWAGQRDARNEHMDDSGGKGWFSGKRPTQRIYYESAWHQLGIGPVDILHGIYKSGRLIFQGPITRTSHPSGTEIDLGMDGSFFIYWGENIQPVNSILSSELGIASKWPYICFIVWNRMRLGTVAQWPTLEYDVERYVSNTVLTDSNAYIDPDISLSATSVDVYNAQDGISGVGYIDVSDDWSSHFHIGDIIKITGNAIGDQDLHITDVTTYSQQEYVYYTIKVWRTYTRFKFAETLSGTDDEGYLTLYTADGPGGINAAHGIAELLFAEYPQGLHLEQSEWDIDALEELGILVSEGEENLPCSLLGLNGEEAQAILAGTLQDLGVMVPIHSHTGKVTFTPLRAPTGTLETIQAEQLNDPLPEVETLQGENRGDKYVFSFQDYSQGFHEMTIAIDEDGQASYLEHQRATQIALHIPIDFAVAVKIAERRSQEEIGGATTYDIKANHGARTLMPGQPILVDGINDTLRVSSVSGNPDTGKITIKAISDLYGVPTSQFENEEGGGEISIEPPIQDEFFTMVEIPEYWLNGEPMTIMVPRIRGASNIVGANIYISRDDSTYTQVDNEIASAAGGILIDALPASGERSIAQGPTFTALGPDITGVLDLSSDELNWRLGRQLVVIGTEVMFCQKITALGGDTYRLDGLLRARWDTELESHVVGKPVFIFEANDFGLIQDLLLAPDVDLYIKTQAYSSGGIANLDSSPKILIDNTVGKGTVPMRPLNLTVTAPAPLVHAYEPGNNIEIGWSYMSAQSPGTGAGMQAKGNASISSAIDVEFRLQILTAGGVLKRTIITPDLSYTYTNAALIADFGSQPATFKANLVCLRGGYISTEQEITITKE
jgi:hypothetical protein